jgi:hypothetical protein
MVSHSEGEPGASALHNPGHVAETRGNSIIGVLGVLTAVSIAAIIAVMISEPSPSALNTYSTYLSHVNLYWAGFFCVLAAGAVGIPFYVGVGQLLRSQSPSVAPAAAIATVTGILILLLGSCLTVGAYWAITQVPVGSTYQSNAVFEAAFWSEIGAVTSILGYALVGVGFILFGWLGWKSDVWPNWLAVVALVAGVAGILAAALSFIAIIFVDAGFIVLGIVIGVHLLRPPGSARTSQPSSG